MIGNRSNAASMPAAVRGSGSQTARLITFEKESSGDRRALRSRSYASRSMAIVFVGIHYVYTYVYLVFKSEWVATAQEGAVDRKVYIRHFADAR